MSTTMSPAGEAGPSKQPKATHEDAPVKLVKMRKKTGGTGKKGKKFMDDKTSILDLVQNVTSAKEASVHAKLSKSDRAQAGVSGPTKANAQPLGSRATKDSKAPLKEGTERKKSRAVQRKLDINRAKVALIAKDEEKKRKKKAPLEPSKPTQRRKVAFST